MRVETSNIRDLPDLPRIGLTCSDLNGQLLFIWGGNDEKTVYSTERNNQLWIYEAMTGYWRQRTCSGECPPHLSGAASALIGRRMYLFGGHSTVQDSRLNSLYCLDLDTFVWKDLGSRATGDPSQPIPADKCVAWSYGGLLYIFGGYGSSHVENLLELLGKQRDLELTTDQGRWPRFSWNNQLVEYNPSKNKWIWPFYTGRCPSARAAHSGAKMGDRYYIFGGRDCRERLNDLYYLDMTTFQWHLVSSFSDPSLTGPLRPPIRHLLESVEEEELEVDDIPHHHHHNHHQDDSHSLVDAEVDINESEIERREMEIPAPSCSNQARSNQQACCPNLALLGYDDDDDDESDSGGAINDKDAIKYPPDYSCSSHLLERWSISSHPSTSSNTSNPFTCSGELPEHITMNDHVYIETETHSQAQSERTQVQLGAQQVQEDLAPSLPPADIDQLPEQPERTKAVPKGRSFSSFTPISQENILLYGGVSSNDENLSDCWIFNIKSNTWTLKSLRVMPRLWHTGSRTENNEVVVIGGSCSEKVDEFCSDVLIIALEPKSLKKLALDAVSRSVRLRSIDRVKGLPSTLCKIIRLRKQAMNLTMRKRKLCST